MRGRWRRCVARSGQAAASFLGLALSNNRYLHVSAMGSSTPRGVQLRANQPVYFSSLQPSPSPLPRGAE